MTVAYSHSYNIFTKICLHQKKMELFNNILIERLVKVSICTIKYYLNSTYDNADLTTFFGMKGIYNLLQETKELQNILEKNCRKKQENCPMTGKHAGNALRHSRV